MSYYDHQQQPPVGVPPPQGNPIVLFSSFFLFSFFCFMGCYKNLILIIESCVFVLKGIHQKMLTLHQGTLNKVTLNKGTLLKVILNKGTLNKVTHHNSMLNSLSRTKKLGFLKDGMSCFMSLLFLLCMCCYC